MITGITQITPVKGRKDFIFKNIGYWLNQSIDQLIIVDMACPDRTGPELINSKYSKDPRLIVIVVDKELTGPFYNHGFARNIGVHAARNDVLFFLDADCKASDTYIKDAHHNFSEMGCDIYCNLPQDFIVSNYLAKQPEQLSLDRQLFVRNALFYDINGFNQDYLGYGAETYDLILRAHMATDKITYSRLANLLRVSPHDNIIRSQFLPFSINNEQDYVNNIFLKSLEYYKRAAKLSPRTQPGTSFGVGSKASLIKVYKSGTERAFAPGDDI